MSPEQQSPIDSTKNKKIIDVILIIFSLLFVIGGMVFIRFYPEKNSQQEDKNINVNDLPVVPSTSTIKVEEITVPLITSDFIAPQDIYRNPDSYNRNVVRLALIGEFEIARLKVVGTIDNKYNNFLSISIGDVSGTVGGYRNSANTLDLKKSTGIFSKKNPMHVSIDLQQSIRLSTTESEYLSSYEPFKQVVLWNRIKPPSSKNVGTIANMIMAPYSERGIYGDGVVINRIEFVYTCKIDSECLAVVCDKNINSGSECLKQKFGERFGDSSWKSYAEYFTN